MSKEEQQAVNPENLPVVQQPAPANVPVKNGVFAPVDLEGVWRLAVILSSSGVVPEAYRRKTEDTFVAISWGMEIGLSHNQSLQAIAVIDGKPSIYGDVGLALVRGSGKLEDINEFFDGEFGHDNYMAVCELKRKGEKRVHRSEFSIEDAKLMGKWNERTKKGYPSVWMKHPKRMLKWRARWFALRDVFGDVLKGLGIVEEVLDSIDMEEDASGDYSVKKPASTTVKTPAKDESPNGTFANESEEEASAEPDASEYVNPGTEIESEAPTDAQEVKTPEDRFYAMLGDDLRMAAEGFVEKACEINGCPADEIYNDALGRPDEFIKLIQNWAKRTAAPKKAPEPAPKEETVETVTEEPEAALVDPIDIIHSKAAMHYNGELADGTAKLLTDYVEYVNGLAGLTPDQILTGLEKTPDDWFKYFEDWCQVQLDKAAEKKVAETDTTETPDTGPEVDNTGLIKPDVLSWPGWKLKWNTMKPEDYKGFVWSDLERFVEAEKEAPAIAKRAREKWSKYLPDDVYPVDAQREEAQKEQTSIASGEEGADANVDARWEFVNKNYPKETKASMEKRNFAVGALSPGAKQMVIQDVYEACNPQ
jgi:hypothetical protein